jgi:hypothetical protein
MVLLPKKSGATTMREFQPIPLIHVVGKLFSKVLARMLAPHLDKMLHINQSAFVKDRYIQDKLRLVQSSAKLLHAQKQLSLLLKMDIARAFDSVAWSFLIEVLRHLGFPLAWLDWNPVLLSTANTRVLLNGNPGRRICHARGMRQGDPLLPMLFQFIMEVLNGLIRKAEVWELFSDLAQE